ncbi:MAG: hypothetical protein EOP11_18975 [Proteobacteria bacterium]|nr:MAG: hypothetical protein EOP11_18975 [Pseudomonadota bacterium]
MKIFSLIFLALIAIPSFAYTPKQTAQTFRSCQSILKQRPAKQAELARRAGVSRAVLVDNCRIFVAKGLKRNIELEKEYMDWANGRGKFAPGKSDGDGWGGSCTSQSGCLAHQQCIGGHCESRNVTTCDNGARSCGLYQRCVNGACQ